MIFDTVLAFDHVKHRILAIAKGSDHLLSEEEVMAVIEASPFPGSRS